MNSAPTGQHDLGPNDALTGVGSYQPGERPLPGPVLPDIVRGRLSNPVRAQETVLVVAGW